jgi:hypothetical protein
VTESEDCLIFEVFVLLEVELLRPVDDDLLMAASNEYLLIVFTAI